MGSGCMRARESIMDSPDRFRGGRGHDETSLLKGMAWAWHGPPPLVSPGGGGSVDNSTATGRGGGEGFEWQQTSNQLQPSIHPFIIHLSSSHPRPAHSSIPRLLLDRIAPLADRPTDLSSPPSDSAHTTHARSLKSARYRSPCASSRSSPPSCRSSLTRPTISPPISVTDASPQRPFSTFVPSPRLSSHPGPTSPIPRLTT